MIFKYIDPEVIYTLIAIVVITLVFFVGRDADAATAQTVVNVTVSAEVACTPDNEGHSITCLQSDEILAQSDIQEPSLWSKIVDIFLFW